MPLTVEQRMDPAPYLALVNERFGLEEHLFAGYDFYRATSQTIYLVPKGAPLGGSTLFAGFAFLRDHTRYPKLTTAAAIKYAPLATRNVASLSQADTRAFLNRETFACEPGPTCTGTGFLLVQHGMLPVGIGFYSAERGTLRSLFPKTWSGVHHHTIVVTAG